MTPSGVYNTRNVRRRPELERLVFEFLTTLKGTPWNPNPAAGEMAADALPADMTVPNAGARTSPSGRGGGGAGGPSSKQVVHQEIRCAEIRLRHELSWICRSVMKGTTARAHTEECRRRSEECLAEDEETKFRSEAAKLRVDGWLAGRVESAEQSTR